MRRKPLEAATLALALAGAGYLAFALAQVRRFRRREQARARVFPAVSILKPLHGEEPGLYANLCSFCEQDYPEFEVVFGVRDARDPATAVARRVVARFPGRARLVTGDGTVSALNPKVANLSRIAACAAHELVVVADADMRVTADYLRSIVAPFEDDRVGAVTCLYAGSADANLASRLGAMFINEQFAPSVLVAAAIEPLRYCFGATIAIRRSLLEGFGSFAALADHVADDHLIGRLVAERGWRVVLSSYVVENVVHERDFGTLWARELRWSRTIRSVRPLGHAFSFVTFGLPLAALAALVARDARSGVVLGIAAALRLALHNEADPALGVRRTGSAILIPLRDLLSVAVWGSAFFDRGVVWREQRLALDPRGRILRR
jgi:ceramide glucosyltransferase